MNFARRIHKKYGYNRKDERIRLYHIELRNERKTSKTLGFVNTDIFLFILL